MNSVIRQPLAWLPVAISLFQLAMIGWAVAAGIVSTGDEGTPARTFQLLMVVQALIILTFAVRWLPRAPSAAAIVLAAQITVAAIPVATILLLEA